MDVRHLTWQELSAGINDIARSPRDEGRLEMIVRRPAVDAREVLEAGELTLEEGLVGDTWRLRRSSRRSDGSPHPDMQLNIMNVRAVALVAQDRSRWALAGDQLFVDLDLAEENLPPWTRLQIGSAVVQVTDQPHTGCGKFAARFGVDAQKFVNSGIGRRLHLRGINARVLAPGIIRTGDFVGKL